MTQLKQRSGDQPLPVKNDSTPIQDLVIADMEARKAIGLRRYGTLLQAHNGRDALRDAYEEALDLAVCLRQCIEERVKVTEVERVGPGVPIPEHRCGVRGFAGAATGVRAAWPRTGTRSQYKGVRICPRGWITKAITKDRLRPETCEIL